MAADSSTFKPIQWLDGGKVTLIDQTRLPLEEVWLVFDDYRDVISAIAEMRIRGAPAIGIAAAYAVALAAREFDQADEGNGFLPRLETAAEEITRARPTAVNLSWAVERMLRVARKVSSGVDAVEMLIGEARLIHKEDEAANHRMGRFGADLLPQRGAVLTHCNAGALATGGYGTALGVIRTAWGDGKISQVYATETRPFLQGARLTAWELLRDGIDATLLPDSAAGGLLRQHEVQAVVVGADRIAANGDVANKVGTYSLAVLARENGIDFYIAAPTSTIDLSLASGELIPIEMRSAEEVLYTAGVRTAPEGVSVLNPAFDVTPHNYVTAIITERGVVREPYTEGLRRLFPRGTDD